MKGLLGGVALAGLISVAAHAADMNVYKAPPPVVAPPTWTGFYVGAHAGAAWGRSDTVAFSQGGLFFLAANFAPVNALGASSLKDTSFLGGVQAGYNLQMSSVVVGVELDYSFMHLRDSSSLTGAYAVGVVAPNNLFRQDAAMKADGLFTARGRLGYAFGNVLAYATGGLAVSDFRYTHAFSDNTGGAGFGVVERASASHHLGWTAGGGIEMQLSKDWSAKAEYLHVDLGDLTTSSLVIAPDGRTSPMTHRADFTVDIARLGFNYRFSTAPLVARY
jgi:outer membrane immunogenic protein